MDETTWTTCLNKHIELTIRETQASLLLKGRSPGRRAEQALM